MIVGFGWLFFTGVKFEKYVLIWNLGPVKHIIYWLVNLIEVCVHWSNIITIAELNKNYTQTYYLWNYCYKRLGIIFYQIVFLV